MAVLCLLLGTLWLSDFPLKLTAMGAGLLSLVWVFAAGPSTNMSRDPVRVSSTFEDEQSYYELCAAKAGRKVRVTAMTVSRGFGRLFRIGVAISMAVSLVAIGLGYVYARDRPRISWFLVTTSLPGRLQASWDYEVFLNFRPDGSVI